MSGSPSLASAGSGDGGARPGSQGHARTSMIMGAVTSPLRHRSTSRASPSTGSTSIRNWFSFGFRGGKEGGARQRQRSRGAAFRSPPPSRIELDSIARGRSMRREAPARPLRTHPSVRAGPSRSGRRRRRRGPVDARRDDLIGERAEELRDVPVGRRRRHVARRSAAPRALAIGPLLGVNQPGIVALAREKEERCCGAWDEAKRQTEASAGREPALRGARWGVCESGNVAT